MNREIFGQDRGYVVETVRVSMRHYFSTYLLWAAEDNAARAGAIEAVHEGGSRFDIEHQGLVLGTILGAANFLEAMINELYQDAHDDHGTAGDGYIAPLSESTRQALAQLWTGTAEGSKLRPLEKYQLLLVTAGHSPLERGAQPYQDADLVIQLRNVIAHYQPKDLAADSPTRMEQRLRGKFAENVLMAGAGNPWWPSHCLGYGCASWAWQSALAFSDAVANAVGVTPNYRRLRTDHWKGFGREPGSPPGA
ncbi:MAG: hypothetical protein H0T61_03365 [Actinobacteria bacterium]|nr:hypothetical protein [Actinomycetota bacterium]